MAKELVLVGEFGVTHFQISFYALGRTIQIDRDPHKRPQLRLVIWLSDDVDADRSV
jgi:hypothetical protein